MRILSLAILFVGCIALCLGDAYYDATVDAKNRDAYYKSNGNTYDALNSLVTKTHVRQYSYDVARHTYLYPLVDQWEDGKLRGIYTQIAWDAPAMNESFAEAAVPYNCEHAVPQSWFSEGSPMKADLHHLFTAQMECNSYRNNFPYGKYSKTVRSRAGCGEFDESTPLAFEPVNGKGAAARATLYFLVRYPGYVTTSDMPYTGLTTLVQWAMSEPVSLWEKHRNYAIYSVQGNRNPFIDYPAWAGTVDFKRGYGAAEMIVEA